MEKGKKYSFAFLIWSAAEGFLLQHTSCGTLTQTHTLSLADYQALFALEGVSLTLWEIKWRALLAGLLSAQKNCKFSDNCVIFTWVSSSKEGLLNKQRDG